MFECFPKFYSVSVFWSNEKSITERGTTSTTLEKLSMICRHYNVSADYLLGLTDDPEPKHEVKP